MTTEYRTLFLRGGANSIKEREFSSLFGWGLKRGSCPFFRMVRVDCGFCCGPPRRTFAALPPPLIFAILQRYFPKDTPLTYFQFSHTHPPFFMKVFSPPFPVYPSLNIIPVRLTPVPLSSYFKVVSVVFPHTNLVSFRQISKNLLDLPGAPAGNRSLLGSFSVGGKYLNFVFPHS